MIMNFLPLAPLSTLSLLASLVQAQITLGQDSQASGTLLLTNIPSPSLLDNGTSAGLISGSSLDSSCPFPVRKKGAWKYGSTGQSEIVPFGPYINGNGALTVFQTYGIPDGASIDEPLDVFTGPDIDLDIWFTISYVSPCIAHYTCSRTDELKGQFPAV
ncbi:hypothetical protein ONZ45_g9403 [Pleurotus djamor]|nr:hypothetical protein ONZ45_g9403 [Pleurotus djamor]